MKVKLELSLNSATLFQCGQGLDGAAKQSPPVWDVDLASVVYIQIVLAQFLCWLWQGDPEGYLVGHNGQCMREMASQFITSTHYSPLARLRIHFVQ